MFRTTFCYQKQKNKLKQSMGLRPNYTRNGLPVIKMYCLASKARDSSYKILELKRSFNSNYHENCDNYLSMEYSLEKYHRSNQDTCLVHKPAVVEGQWVESGDLLADCSASVGGELSLGQNLLIGYMPWEGYNFEDAILISERLVYDDLYTSIHIEKYEVNIEENKLGKEEITREIPEVDPESLKNLNSLGLIKMGSWVQEGDILVGKVTPVNKKAQSNYQKLLYLILDKTVSPVRDSSLRAPKGIKAKVIAIQIFKNAPPAASRGLSASSKSLETSFKSMAEEHKLKKQSPLTNINKKLNKQKKQNKAFFSMSFGYKQNFESFSFNHFPNRSNKSKKALHAASRVLNITYPNEKLNKTNFSSLFLKKALTNKTTLMEQSSSLGDKPLFATTLSNNFSKNTNLKSISNRELKQNVNFNNHGQQQKNLLKGVSSIQIYLAERRRVQVGDKMAGRHGNKGIISEILPIEDLPFLPDGTPLDMVLNPLGVPSRMNVGQIYECLLGLAGKHLGENYKVVPFDEMYGADASRNFVYSKLYKASIKTGKTWLFNPKLPGKIGLYDGRTGESFHQAITVGYAYILRLVHMVDDKVHSRSTGPYSLVTQQPLRGRSKHGGQRLGEMEVWALEGYGAAFTLLEMLTIKSDDMSGRMTLWSNLILNKEISIGTPESFKVLICELQALCLDIGLYRIAKQTI
jgi:DNA-directed RNA polymerase subunit beta